MWAAEAEADVRTTVDTARLKGAKQLPTPLPRAAISESMARWTVVICST
jgi:hypothetical protein